MPAADSTSPDTRRGFSGLFGRPLDTCLRVINTVVGPQAVWIKGSAGMDIGAKWIASRLLMLAMLLTFETQALSDLGYYYGSIHHLRSAGLNHTLKEYPFPVVVLVSIPYVVAAHSRTRYELIYVLMMLFIDAYFCYQIFHYQNRKQSTATALWIAAGPLVGPIIVTRFDLVPGVLVALALLWLVSKPVRSGAAVSLGTGLKLWPILLLPSIAAPKHTRTRVLTSSVVTGTILIGATLLIGGWTRLISPFTYQLSRGLQVESIFAWPLLLLHALHSSAWTIAKSPISNSVEITGPGVRLMLGISLAASACALIFFGSLWLRASRRAEQLSTSTVAFMVVATIGLEILTNKVFSPQYMLWLVPSVIAAIALNAAADADHRDANLQRAATAVLIAGAITQLIYPICYHWIFRAGWGSDAGVLLLLSRDLVLVGVVTFFCRRAWGDTASH